MKPDNKNDFAHCRVDMKNVLRATCSECGEEADRKIASGSRTCDQAFAEKMFRNIRWQLGPDRSKDVCPKCVSAKKAAAAEEKLAEVAAIQCEDSTSITTDKDREALVEMLRESLIESDGLFKYRPGVTDGAIAEATGFRREDVMAIRQEVFGRARRRRGTAGTTAPTMIDPDSRVAELERTVADQAHRIAGLEATQSVLLDRLAKMEKRFLAMHQGMVVFQSRVQELSDDVDHLADPSKLTPSTVTQLFRGAAHLPGRRKAAPGAPRERANV